MKTVKFFSIFMLLVVSTHLIGRGDKTTWLGQTDDPNVDQWGPDQNPKNMPKTWLGQVDDPQTDQWGPDIHPSDDTDTTEAKVSQKKPTKTWLGQTDNPLTDEWGPDKNPSDIVE